MSNIRNILPLIGSNSKVTTPNLHNYMVEDYGEDYGDYHGGGFYAIVTKKHRCIPKYKMSGDYLCSEDLTSLLRGGSNEKARSASDGKVNKRQRSGPSSPAESHCSRAPNLNGCSCHLIGNSLLNFYQELRVASDHHVDTVSSGSITCQSKGQDGSSRHCLKDAKSRVALEPDEVALALRYFDDAKKRDAYLSLDDDEKVSVINLEFKILRR